MALIIVHLLILYCTTTFLFRFNSITTSRIAKVLQDFDNCKYNSSIQRIAEDSRGDVRNAINMLHFYCSQGISLTLQY